MPNEKKIDAHKSFGHSFEIAPLHLGRPQYFHKFAFQILAR